MGPDEMDPGGHGAVEMRGCFLLCGVVSCPTFFFRNEFNFFMSLTIDLCS